jgi:hypothetical protein
MRSVTEHVGFLKNPSCELRFALGITPQVQPLYFIDKVGVYPQAYFAKSKVASELVGFLRNPTSYVPPRSHPLFLLKAKTNDASQP